MSMDDSNADLEGLDLVVGGVRVASLVFSIVIYSREPFRKQGDALVTLQKRFWDLCGHERDWYYASENMARHKALTPRTLGMIASWTKSSAPLREFVSLEIKQGEPFNVASRLKFQVQGTEPGSASYDDGDANLLSFTFPAAWARDRQEEMRTLAVEVFSSMPVVCGQAGYTFELSRYYETGAAAHAWLQSMRYRGIDIAQPTVDRAAVATDGLKGVNWLTMLGPAMAKEVGLIGGSRSGLPRSIVLEQLATGVLIEAGGRPLIGDASMRNDLTDNKAILRLVRPLVERLAGRYPSFWLAGGISSDRTHDWLFRLERNGVGA
ncbi:hypothetical protein BH11PSE13_BH11PSE13_11380 [soil metagenome]